MEIKHYTLDIINDQDEYNVVGIIDSLHPIGSMVHGLRVLGRQSEILKICKKFNVKNAVITIGDNYTRFKVKAELERIMPDLSILTSFIPLLLFRRRQN